MSIICAFQFNVEVEREALRSLIGGMSNRFPGNRVSRDRPVLPQLSLRRQNGSKLCFKGIPRVAAVASSENLLRGGGILLAEVFEVKIDDIDGESPGDLYGTVNAKDHSKIDKLIYDRERVNVESIGPGQSALLTGPNRAILASPSFAIDVALFDKHSDLPVYDKPISIGNIRWSVDKDSFDTLLTHKVVGNSGSATVSYAVLKDAVQASVEVTMIGDGNDEPAVVYGDIEASNTKIKNIKSVLFRKTSHDHISLKSGEIIPLARSIVSVPLDSNLIVRAYLYDYDNEVVIVDGSVSFIAQNSDTMEKKIYGNGRIFKVKVTWERIIPNI